MTKRKLTLILLSALFFACKETPKQETSQSTQIAAADKVVTGSATNKDGQKLNMIFNNTKNTATFIMNGESIELKEDTIASGIKYSNKNYEYREHQGKIELKKDGKIIFKK